MVHKTQAELDIETEDPDNEIEDLKWGRHSAFRENPGIPPPRFSRCGKFCLIP